VQEALRVLRRESQLRTADSTDMPQCNNSVNLWRGLGDTLGLLELAVREEDEDVEAAGDANGMVTAAASGAVSVGLGRGGGNFEAEDLGVQFPQKQLRHQHGWDEHVKEVCTYFPSGATSQHPHSGTWLPTWNGDAADAPVPPDKRQDVPTTTPLARKGSAGMATKPVSPSMAGLAGVKVISGGGTGEAFSRTPPLISLPLAMQLSTPAKGSRAGRCSSGGSVEPLQGAVQNGNFASQKRRVTIRNLADPVVGNADAGREADGGPWAGDRPIEEDDEDAHIHTEEVLCTPTGCACTTRSARTLDDSDDEVLKERLPPRLSMGPRPSPGTGRSGRPMSQARLSELSPDWAAWALAVHKVSATVSAASHSPSISQQRTTLRPL